MRTRHSYRAEWIEGRGLVVTDPTGKEIDVKYGATADTCTCYAYTTEGFIGGWQCMPKAHRLKFTDLVSSINAGVLYGSMDDLPVGARYARKGRR